MAKVSPLVRVASLTATLVGRPTVFWVGAAGFAVGIEVLGRQSSSDRLDSLGVLALLVFARLTALLPSRYVPWRTRGVRWCRVKTERLARSLKHSIGVDLRGSPADSERPEGVPAFRWISAVAWLALGASVALHLVVTLPALRAALLGTSPLLYFSLLGVLWTVLVVGSGIGIVVAYMLAHDRIIRQGTFSLSARKRRTWVWTGAYAAVALACAWRFGPVPGLALAVLALLLAQGYPRHPEGKPLIALVRSSVGRVFSIHFTSFVRQANTWVCLALILAGLTACGFQAELDPVVAVTRSLGTAFLWLTAPLLCLVLARGLALFWSEPRFQSPATPRVKTAFFLREGSGAEGGLSRRELARTFEPSGWAVQIGSKPPSEDRADLWIRPENSAVEDTPAGGRRPPPTVRLDPLSLSEEELSRKLDRLDNVWKRRRLHRALKRLFKFAARRSYKNGSGYIFAPHYWFVPGFTRDEDEDELNFEDNSDGTIGPGYRELLGTRLRRYLREIFDAADIDLIYIEDGVGYRGLRRVMTVLLEVFDIHGGKTRLEERHFVGIPGLRITIDEYGLDHERATLTGYPEPEYEGVGRARILVIYKDRGGDDENLDAPAPEQDLEEEDWEWLKDALERVFPSSRTALH